MPKYKIENTLFPSFLTDLRKRERFSSGEMLGKILCMVKSTYNGYETGATKTIPTDTLERMMTALWQKNKKNNPSSDISLDEYVCRQVRRMKKTYANEILQKQYWLMYLHLNHATVNFSDLMRRELEDMYAADTLTEILSSLNLNPTLKQLYKYEDKNEIYFNPLTKRDEEKGYFPIFRIRFELSDSELDTISQNIQKEGKIDVLTLFMLVFNFEYRRHTNEQDAFIESCLKMHSWEVPFVYNLFGFIELPEYSIPTAYEESAEIIEQIRNVLINTEIPEQNFTMNIFRKNLIEGNLHFLDTIAIDFSFIKNLQPALENELHNQLEETVENFKKTKLHMDNEE